MPRIIAIGDIHGCATALRTLIDVISPQLDDTIIPLGDFINRGPNSRDVVEQLTNLPERCHFIPIMGNHEEMMLGAREGRSDLSYWLRFGGDATLNSYGQNATIDTIPRQHFEFLESCHTYYETDSHFFVHANFKPGRWLDEQDIHTLRW